MHDINARCGKLERNCDGQDGRDGKDDTGRPDRLLTQADTERLARARFEEVHQYFTDQYARRDVLLQTRTPGGLLLDWVPIESQQGCATLADPPDEDRPVLPDRTATERREQFVSFELDRPGAVRGPLGSVPVWRRDLDRLCTLHSLND